MNIDLEAWAKERGVKYFMISYTDLFGGQRAKLVPTQAIKGMQEDGAGFAGFATWLDLTPPIPTFSPSQIPPPSSSSHGRRRPRGSLQIASWTTRLSIRRRA
jgi:hypothetical protein